MADDSIISYSDLIGDDGAFDQILKDIKKIEKELIASAKRIKKEFSLVNPNDVQQIEALEKQTKELVQANKNLAKATTTVNKAKKTQAELTKEQLIQQEALKLERREALRIAKQQAIILKEEGNTIKSLRAQLSLVTIQWSKLTQEEIENGKRGKELAATKKNLTDQLKALEKATGDNRRNVGNYSDALKNNDKITQKLANSVKRLRKDMMRVFVGRTIVDGVRNLVIGLGRLVDKFAESNSAIAGIQATIGKVTGAFEFAGTKILEFFAPAIERIGILLFKLPAFFAGVGAAAREVFGFLDSAVSAVTLRVRLFGLELEKAFKAATFGDTTEVQRRIDAISEAIERNSNAVFDIPKAYREAYDATLKEQQEFIAEQEKQQKDAEAKRLKAIKEQELAAAQARIKAFESIQRELRRLEIENIRDAQQKAIELEEMRYSEQRRLQTEQLEQLKKDFADNEEKLLEIRDLSQELAEQSYEKHQQNLRDIRDDYALSTEEITPIEVAEVENEKVEQLLDERVQKTEEANAKIRASNIETIQQISQVAEKIGAEIVKLLEKQADIAQENVDNQVDNLERARERAAQGLESNLAFEEKELARRQQEQQQKQKQAEQAAKLLALFNLVAAYAQNGDENALFRALADFALLEAASSAIQGTYFDGTEDTGTVLSPLDNKGGRLAILHNNERVMTKAQNSLLNGMSNDDVVKNALIGEQMGDYFNPTATNKNLFAQQKEDFVNSMQGGSNTDNSKLIAEVQGLRKDMAKQPNWSAEFVKLREDVYGLITQQDRQGMKKVYRAMLQKKRL